MRILQRFLIPVLQFALLACVAPALPAQMASTPAVHHPGPNEGKRPAGWMTRADSGAGVNAADTVRLVDRAPGWHMASGPTALVWRPRDIAHGIYVATATVYLGPPRFKEPSGYGMFFGGKNMEGKNASYTELLIRNDEKFLVRRRDGSKTTVLKDWSPLFGLGIHEGQRDHITRNVFRVVVDEKLVSLVVNRVAAFSMLRKDVVTDGTFGIRLGAGQELTVDEIGLDGHMVHAPMAPPPFPKPKGVPSVQRRG